ncbi:hypothetical protein CONPUDRAFT_148093 [Coniophora puteana RWD-64-598 SS2]|uniref:F-box domain-containing protein n=1 Tax=Coniophora puteana (strain RWD-64-598) TaxID=741705 RepID=A0A5M3N3H5_CONPW|nr:uncharacterized protein CONPUDRAFT_148093 [Coniophora puteana RWD-64-598 SS2]EIW85962.1 hypothetical protein CONPUDRAFT_148093 [Coniophora puteana RWD-64-598 SS2]
MKILPPETIREICKYCTGWDVWETRKALASLARTSKAFRDESSDELWASVPVKALFDALPSRTILKIGISDKAIVKFKSELMTASDWDSFYRRTFSVRELYLDNAGGVEICILSSIFPSQSHVEQAIPRLIRLHLPRKDYYGHSTTPWLILQVFLVPKLQFLKVNSFGESGWDFIKVVPKRCPVLESLDLSQLHGWPNDDKAVFSDMIRELENLKSYNGPIFQERFGRGLSLLPRLEHVSIETRFGFDRSHSLALGSLPFPALSSISLSVDPSTYGRPGNAIELLRAISSKHGEHERRPLSASIQFVELPLLEDVRECCSILSSYSHFDLQSISLTAQIDDDIEDEDTEVSELALTLIRPLLRSVFLRKAILNVTHQVYFTDADVQEMARAWPHLEILKFNEEACWNTQPKITLDGLRSLLSNCTQLYELAIAITVPWSNYNGAERQLGTLDSTYGIGHAMLAAFNLLDSDIEDELFFCVAIAQLAPYVRICMLNSELGRIGRAVKDAQRLPSCVTGPRIDDSLAAFLADWGTSESGSEEEW